MFANVSQGLQLWTWIKKGDIARKHGAGYLQFLKQYSKEKWRRICDSCWPKPSCFPESVTAPGNFSAMPDDTTILKTISDEIEPYLSGRPIYLVGMMGCGKSTMGKILAEALEYSFSDCDTIIEQAVGGKTVADIFNLYGESFFRENETEVLQKLSSMNRLVVSTGGGAVIRPINWRHMQTGIVIWLDVPLEALARRITAAGTGSRPLLHHESGDPYSKTMKRLSTLFEERGGAYANADIRVSLQTDIAAKLRIEDACSVTPTAIAIEVLFQIESFLKK